MSPKHVALVAPYPPAGERHGGHSGVASYTANLANALATSDLDVEVTVIAPEMDGDPASFDDGPVRVRRAYPLGPRALPEAARAVAATDADIVHLQWELFLYGGAASLAGLLPGLARFRRGSSRSLVTTMHHVVDPQEVEREFARMHHVRVPAPVARTGIAAVQWAISTASAATIVHEPAFARVVPGSIVVPHGIEQVDAPDRTTARERLAVGDRFTVLCFGFLAPYKGLETVLDAAELAGEHVDVVVAGGEHPRLTAEGDGSSYGTMLRQRYGAMARFTGRVPDADVAAWFAAADLAVFAYPKPFAASGALALALAHDTPVLLSPALARCAGAPSIVTAPMQPAALAEQFEHLAGKPAAVEVLRRWASVLRCGRLWPDIAARHAEIYQEVCHVQRRSLRGLRPVQSR